MVGRNGQYYTHSVDFFFSCFIDLRWHLGGCQDVKTQLLTKLTSVSDRVIAQAARETHCMLTKRVPYIKQQQQILSFALGCHVTSLTNSFVRLRMSCNVTDKFFRSP